MHPHDPSAQFHRQCVIHLSAGELTRDQLGNSIATAIGQAYSTARISTDWADIAVSDKDAQDRALRPGETHELEALATETTPTEVFKFRLKSLLSTLAEIGYRPIAACDFEDELA